MTRRSNVLYLMQEQRLMLALIKSADEVAFSKSLWSDKEDIDIFDEVCHIL